MLLSCIWSVSWPWTWCSLTEKAHHTVEILSLEMFVPSITPVPYKLCLASFGPILLRALLPKCEILWLHLRWMDGPNDFGDYHSNLVQMQRTECGCTTPLDISLTQALHSVPGNSAKENRKTVRAKWPERLLWDSVFDIQQNLCPEKSQ